MLVEQLTCGEKEVKRGWILSSLNWDPDVRLELTSIHNIIVYWRKILILTEPYKEYSRIIITHKTIITHKMKYFLLEQIYDMICHWDFFMKSKFSWQYDNMVVKDGKCTECLHINLCLDFFLIYLMFFLRLLPPQPVVNNFCFLFWLVRKENLCRVEKYLEK